MWVSWRERTAVRERCGLFLIAICFRWTSQARHAIEAYHDILHRDID